MKMNNFWKENIPAGYYDKLLSKGLDSNRGIQANWHHSTFSYVKDLFSDKDIHLDYACGPGTLIGRYLNSKSIGIDISKNQILYASSKYSNRGEFYTLQDFSFEEHSNTFDKVTILGLFEFITDEEIINLLDKIYKTLKNDGEVLITTPNYKSAMFVFEKILNKISSVNYEDQHINRFNKKRLEKLFYKTKFSKVEVLKILNFGVFFGFINFKISNSIQKIIDKITNKNFGYLLLGKLKK